MRYLGSVVFVSLLFSCGPPPLPPEDAQRIPVRTARVEREAFQPLLTLLGTVRAAASVEVVAQVGGRVSYPDRFSEGLATGARVTAGEHLATLAHPQVELALDEAELNAASAEAELSRHRRAVELGVEAEVELARWETAAALARERLEAAREETGWVQVTAPMTGSLVVDRVRPRGSEIPVGTVLATVAAEGRPRVEAWAAAADRALLEPGLTAVLRRDEEVVGEAMLLEVASVVDAAGTVRVMAQWEGEGPYLVPGEGVELEVRLALRHEVLTIPEEALVVSAGGSAVFVHQPSRAGGTVRREPVTVAGRGDGRVEIPLGLDEGERVVVSGVSLLTDGADVVETGEE